MDLMQEVDRSGYVYRGFMKKILEIIND